MPKSHLKDSDSELISDFKRPVILFGLIGQSNADGANCRYRHVEDPAMPPRDGFSGCYIFDKVARKDRLQIDVDGKIRPLTPGYAHGALEPWNDLKNDFFGPELTFALDSHRALGHTVVIVKLAIGGSRVGNGEYHNWNVDSHVKYGLLKPYLAGYWDKVLKWVETHAKDFRVGGMVSMVGGSDARTKSDALSYASNMADIIRATSEHVKPTGIEPLPWLVIKTPRIADEGVAIGFLDEVRKSQDRLAALPGVSVEELAVPSFHANDRIHLDTKGVIGTGRQMAAWAYRQI